jgi:hypothetical protein
MEGERRLSLSVRSNWTGRSISLISRGIVDDRPLTVGSRPGFYGRSGHRHTQWHGSSDRCRNAFHRRRFLLHLHEALRWKRRLWGRPSASVRFVSTKGVHGMWITMLMNSQYHAVPRRLTDCLIHRQNNPCNFIEMYFFTRRLYRGECRFRVTRNIQRRQAYRSVRTERTKFSREPREKRDERDERRFKVAGSKFDVSETSNQELRTSDRACRARPARRAIEKPAR